jgi:hypothetical protein
MDEMWYIHTMEYYPAIKRIRVEHDNMEDLGNMLRERSETQRPPKIIIKTRKECAHGSKIFVFKCDKAVLIFYPKI